MTDARARLAVVLARWRDATAEVAECLSELAAEDRSPPAAPDLSVAQLAERLGRSASAVRAWVETGLFEGAYRLPGAKRPGAWRIPPRALVSFTEQRRPTARPEDGLGRAIATRVRTKVRPPRARPGALPDLGAWRAVRKDGADA